MPLVITPLNVTESKLKITGIIPDGVGVELILTQPALGDKVLVISPSRQHKFNTFVALGTYQAEMVIKNHSYVFSIDNSIDLTAKISEMDAQIIAAASV